MTLTMTATARSSDGYVSITISGPETVTAVRRTDASGVAEVRAVDGYFPRSGTYTFADWESSLTGTVVYSAIGAAGVLATARTTMAATLPRINVPAYPERGLVLQTVTGYDSARETGEIAHKIIGREDPVVAMGTMSTRAGDLEILAGDHGTAVDIVELLKSPAVFLFRQADHPGLDMYFTAASAKEALTDGAWIVTVGYTEVRRPDTPRAPASTWTYATLKAAYPTYGDLVASFPAYRDVRANDPWLPGEAH